MQDMQMQWIRKRKVFTPFELNGLITNAIDEAGSATFVEGALIHAPVTATVRLFEINDFGIVGIRFANAGEILRTCIEVPVDLNPDFSVGFRVIWTNSAAASAGRGVTWVITLAKDLANAAMTAAASVTTALDTPLVEKLISAAWAREYTARGIKNKLGLTRAQIESGVGLRVNIEADILDAGSVDITLLGLEIDYAPQTTVGTGTLQDPPLRTSGV